MGSLRNTRYITVTSTIKKTFATAEPSSSISPTEPLTENILANTGAAYESSLPLDSSVATLPAISLEAGQATPPLETLTETFSTTQTLLKTHMLPVIYGGNSTTRLTLVQTYNIARMVTAIKTLPPMEIYQFIPSRTLNEFNSKLDEAGSELHLELDFSEDDRDDEDVPKRVVVPNHDADSDLDVFKSASPSKVKTDVVASSSAEAQLTPEQLALFKYFGQPQPQVITTSRPVVVLETLYESHVIPVVNAGNTVFSTLSRPVGTVPRLVSQYSSNTLLNVFKLARVRKEKCNYTQYTSKLYFNASSIHFTATIYYCVYFPGHPTSTAHPPWARYSHRRCHRCRKCPSCRCSLSSRSSQ